MRRAVAALVLVAALAAHGMPATTTGAQEPQPTNEVPTQDIVPKPNSGQAPEDAGDRGGALQLLVLALIVGAVGFGAWRLSAQVRNAKRSTPPPG